MASDREPIEVGEHVNPGMHQPNPGMPPAKPDMPPGLIEIVLPWPPATLSPNARPHYMALARAKKAYRSDCWYSAHSQGLRKIAAERVAASFTFYPPTKRRIDLDNCIARMKSGIDALADVLGVDDSLWTMTFALAGETGGMVRISVEAA